MDYFYEKGEAMSQHKIYCQMFGMPKVRMDGEEVFFQFSKMNALLYYLMVNHTASRYEVAGFLWPNKSDEVAKKNLRNTIYQLNKKLDMELITSPNKVLLSLNKDEGVQSDVDLFLTQPQENLDLYQGDFLQGFFLKDCESYEFWITKMKTFYEKKFVRECYAKIEGDIAAGQLEDVEKNIQRLIYIDEFDERNHQLLMTFYQDNHQHGKVIEKYYDLSNSLKMELGINPSAQTRKIFEKSLEIVNQNSNLDASRSKGIFFGRHEEIRKLEINFKRFREGNVAQSVLVLGDAGIGKSTLVNRVLDDVQTDFFLLETQCYQAEQQYPLMPWKQIVDKLQKVFLEENIPHFPQWQEVMTHIFPGFDLQKMSEKPEIIHMSLLSQVIVEAIKRISEVNRLVFVFEDIQWLDETSIALLSSILLHVKQTQAVFIFTSRREFNQETDNFFSLLKRYEKLVTIELEPFNFDEMVAFTKKKLPEKVIREEVLENLYANTEGNPFFLVEYLSLIESDSNLDIMTVKMKDALKNRFLYLSPEEFELVTTVACFYDSAPLAILSEVLMKDTMVLVNSIENLGNKNILTEQMQGEQIEVKFTHSRLREYLCMNQSNFKKRALHRKIALILEKELDNEKNDNQLYSKIFYHYEQANEKLKSLEYELEYLKNYLGFQHELFPIYHQNYYTNEEQLGFEQEAIFKLFVAMKEKMVKIEKDCKEEEEYQKLLVEFLYLEGRYLIRYGKYEQGIKDIQQMITKAKTLNLLAYVLEGYKQMIYYYIQIDNASEMASFVELALELSIRVNNYESIGILLRLKGLCNIMSGNFRLAESLLRESIHTFKVTDSIAQKYSLNIAAAYNYLGEIHHIEGQYEKALAMFKKALELSEGTESFSSFSVFYINTGVTLFVQGNYSEAKKYFSKAYELYNRFSSLWKRPQLDAYMALINLQEKDYEAVYKYLLSTRKYADKLSNPRDLGIMYFVEAVVKNYLNQSDVPNERLAQLLEKNLHYYTIGALKKLSVSRDKYEIAQLNALLDEKN
ncbi:MAG: AAA family ATPase [Lactobacillales bacterium]|jgi:DNA-binding SARP family transcriptional activator/predicted ATPase|nr:AAA family ATPase [Lactobacillales bacterium]